jgi:hypothetical protein
MCFCFFVWFDSFSICSCPRGFIRTSNGSCNDINECESTARCDAENQVCFNTEGSYNCLDILPASTACSEGYRYNYKSEQCQGILLNITERMNIKSNVLSDVILDDNASCLQCHMSVDR